MGTRQQKYQQQQRRMTNDTYTHDRKSDEETK